MENSFEGPPPGVWRGSLELYGRNKPDIIKLWNDGEKIKATEIVDGELPFQFEFEHQADGDIHFIIKNGEERIVSKDVTHGRDRANGHDTVRIDFPHYNSYISAIYESDVMEGFFYDLNRGTAYMIPFVGMHGQPYRFTSLRKEPLTDVSGKWEVIFTDSDSSSYPAIGEFKQDGNYLTGTFLTETGDYRFLEGTAQANKLYMSVFDGSHAFLFEAKLSDENTMIGSFRSGNHYESIWTAKRNSDVILTNPDSLTYLKDGFSTLDFQFKNQAGKIISPNSDEYKNTVRIIQVLGTWCPNCADETEFLVEYRKNNPNKKFNIIGLAFEKLSQEESNKLISTYKERFNIDYEILYAGSYRKKEASQALPMLNKIISYPTMIFMDKTGKVRKIHTGFNGPATSKYEEFSKEFDVFLTSLINE